MRWLTILIILNQLNFSIRAQPAGLPPPVLITDKQGLPQGFVPGLLQDQRGFIWMATRDGLCRYDGNRFKVFQPEPGGSPSFSDLRMLQQDKQGNIWLTSEQSNIALFDPRTEIFTNFSRQIFGRLPLDKLEIQQAYPDRQNRLWVALTGQGLICFNISTKQIKWFKHLDGQPASLASDAVRNILQDVKGNIWIATAAGLDQFQEHTGDFTHHNSQSQTPLALPETDLYTLYLRPSGEILIGSARFVTRFNPGSGQVRSYRLPADGETIWGMRFSTDSRGVVYFDQRDRLFRFSDDSGAELLARFTSQTGLCASLFIDRSDVLWLGMDGLGVRKYDLRTDGFKVAPYKLNFQTDLLTQWLGVPGPLVIPYVKWNNPYHFRYTLDGEGSIWINVGSSIFYLINPVTKENQKISFPISFTQTISPLATDKHGRVWVLYNYQFWWYDGGRRQWVLSPYRLDHESLLEILQMVVDERFFWLATKSRGLFRLDRQTGKLDQYTNQPGRSTSLSNNALFCLSTDSEDSNRLWIGTYGSGLCAFDKESGQFRRVTDRDGLPNNVIYSAIPDQEGYLWIGTNRGLCRMNRKTFQIQVYTTEDGLLANEFNRFHYLQFPGGKIVMGGVEGLTVFEPGQFRDDDFEPQVELTELQINNRTIEPGIDSLLALPIQAVNSLTLPHYKNFITVQFAALQFNRPGKNRYRYQLKGIDAGWIESRQPRAVYTALPPGKYTLLVNASNISGHWSRYVRSLSIIITTPWWRTGWAYLLYLLIALGITWYGFRLYLKRLRLQQAILLRQQEAVQLRALDEMKSRFFTNITHDFRTPLTLILSPLDILLQDLAGTPYQKRLGLIQRNAKQLLRLINEVLDFSKLDARLLAVNTSRGNLGEFVDQTLQLFKEEAVAKSVELIYKNEVEGDYWFDAGKLERILSNLVANALKFTPENGQVTVSLQDTGSVFLTVSDAGIGIPKDKIPHIFDRFFQVDGAQINSSGGTGIGLAMVKEMVELQGGQLEVKSELGKGTTFFVTLPFQSAGDPVNHIVDSPPPTALGEFSHPMASSHRTPLPPQSANTNYPESNIETGLEQRVILLVEDNPEMGDFIACSLPEIYRISRAVNGSEGLQLAFNEVPDLVISDVMMPVMDGYALCRQLKQDERTSHIPVILLTARAAFDSRMEGLGQGADDYLTKPFHVQELKLRIHNLLERQYRLREHMRQELSRPDNAPANSTDLIPPDPFLQKLYLVVEENLDDGTFGVEELATKMNMSRVHLHRKLKALTGLPAGTVIRNYRLKRATHYLRQGLNSSETAYQVGFDSPPYFAKCFREVYQMSPGEFSRRL